MKNFNYYYDKEDYSLIDKARKIVYDEYEFNPRKIDSKSEEQRIRDELEVKVKEKYKEFLAECGDVWEEFERDLYEHYGVSDNPRRKKLFEIAKYETGDDFEDIYYLFGKWVEAIKD